MIHKSFIVCVICLFFYSTGYGQIKSEPNAEHTVYKAGMVIPNEVIVQLPKGYDLLRNPVKLDTIYNFKPKKLLSSRENIWLFSFDKNKIEPQAVIRKLYNLNINGLLAQENTFVENRLSLNPNDPLFSSQWQHLKIQTPEAWAITTGGSAISGEDIVVTIIESANVMGHPDLQANHWTNTAEVLDGTDTDGNGYIDDINGWNVQSNNHNIGTGGHGTSVAGMIGAAGDNNLGVVGANWNVKMMVVAGHNTFSQASVVEAYDYALNARTLWNDTNGLEGAFVVATNASWGINFADPNNYPIWCNFYDAMGAAGILNCGATTNVGGVNVDNQGDMPTACPSEFMVSVAATDSNDIIGSGFGQQTIAVGAPGIGVFTTNNNGYGFSSGTSFASPFTAGVIALMYSIPCESFMNLVKNHPKIAAQVVRDALYEGVDKSSHLETRVRSGGRINAKSAIDILMDTVCAAFNNDVGVITITNPLEDQELSSEEIITIQIKNFGTLVQSDFEVSYTINNGTIVTEIYEDPVYPFETVTYSFATTADLSSQEPFTITAFTNLVGDDDSVNDAFTKVFGDLNTGSFNNDALSLSIIMKGDNLFEIIFGNTTSYTDEIAIKVYNLIGQEIMNVTPENHNGTYSYSLDMSPYPSGIYLVKAGNSSGSKVKRIVVK